MNKTKITILSNNLSSNGVTRCLSIAHALSKNYAVEIVGTIFQRGIWAPARESAIPIKSVSAEQFPRYFLKMRELLRLADDDVIIACKLRFPSLGVALLKRLMTGTQVILDIDDEVAMTLPGRKDSLQLRLRNPNGDLTTRLIRHLFWFANTVICVSHFFQKQYGGVVVPHGQDPIAFDPARYDAQVIRHDLEIGDGETLIGFIGTPHPHKGIDVQLEAVSRLQRDDMRVMIVSAAADHPYVLSLQAQYAKLMLLVPPQPLERVPYTLPPLIWCCYHNGIVRRASARCRRN